MHLLKNKKFKKDSLKPDFDGYFLSIRGLGRFSTFAFALGALISLFTSPNLGRLLAAGFFIFGGLATLSVCFISAANGAHLGAIILLSCRFEAQPVIFFFAIV